MMAAVLSEDEWEFPPTTATSLSRCNLQHQKFELRVGAGQRRGDRNLQARQKIDGESERSASGHTKRTKPFRLVCFRGFDLPGKRQSQN